MYNIINYVNVCSNALLALFDNDSCYTIDNDGNYCIDIKNKDIKQLLQYYIRSMVENEYHFGKYNIVVNTCRPSDNWRKELRGAAIKSCKYQLMDEKFKIDKVKLENLLDRNWNILSKEMNKFIWISHHNLDIFDMIIILQKILNKNLNFTHSSYILLTDANNNYIHYTNIDSKYITEMEIMLKNKKLII